MKSINKEKEIFYVKVSPIKDTSNCVDWEHPLDLNTILELSRRGLLKERKVSRKKAA